MVATTVRYLTDVDDTNSRRRRYDRRMLVPVERMSTQLRNSRGGDCEDFAREQAELYRGMFRARAPCASPVVNAARAVARCCVPLVTMGMVPRNGNMGPQFRQYDTGDGHNAHAWLTVMSSASMRSASQTFARPSFGLRASGAAPDVSASLHGDMLDPWDEACVLLFFY